MQVKECLFEIVNSKREKTLDVSERMRGRDVLVRQGLDEETAIAEAQRCLGNRRCLGPGVCQLFCPDSCIAWNEDDGHVVINYNKCKGCSTCAVVCPKGAIKMVLKETER